MKRLFLLVLALALVGVSCERHEFEGPDGTKQLNEKHDTHATHGDGADMHGKPAH